MDGSHDRKITISMEQF